MLGAGGRQLRPAPQGEGRSPSHRFTTAPRQMNVTMRSSKEDIATAAVEIIDTQQERIDQLQQQQTVLWGLVALLAILWAL